MIGVCINDDAHVELREFDYLYQNWEKSIRDQKQAPLSQKLQYFQTSGPNAQPKAIDINCKRFLATVEVSLSGTNNTFRLVHDNYWEAWGYIVGVLLRKQPTESRYDDWATMVLGNLQKSFCENNWDNRQLTVKAFARVTERSLGYDEHMLDQSNYFFGYCKAATSGLPDTLPLAIYNSILGIASAQNSIAKRYEKRKLDVADHGDFLMGLLSSTLQLFELVNRISKSLSEKQRRDVLMVWRQTVFEYLFPAKPLSLERKSEEAEAARKAFETFVDYIQRVRQQKEYADMRPILNHWLKICKHIRKIWS